jgi:hypothetical protein
MVFNRRCVRSAVITYRNPASDMGTWPLPDTIARRVGLYRRRPGRDGLWAAQDDWVL